MTRHVMLCAMTRTPMATPLATTPEQPTHPSSITALPAPTTSHLFQMTSVTMNLVTTATTLISPRETKKTADTRLLLDCCLPNLLPLYHMIYCTIQLVHANWFHHSAVPPLRMGQGCGDTEANLKLV